MIAQGEKQSCLIDGVDFQLHSCACSLNVQLPVGDYVAVLVNADEVARVVVQFGKNSLELASCESQLFLNLRGSLIVDNSTNSKTVYLALISHRLLRRNLGDLVGHRIQLSSYYVNQLSQINLDDSQDQLMFTAKYLQLFGEILACFQPICHGDEMLCSMQDEKSLQVAKEHISTHFNETITIPQLARICGLNECKLKRLFKLKYQNTIYQCVLNHRLELAKKLLQGGNDTIEKIALQCGYENSASFIRVFKNKFAITPDKFRHRKS